MNACAGVTDRMRAEGKATAISFPQKLRGAHFAHNDDHHSVSNALDVEFDGDRFFLKFGLTLGYHIGGATEWHELIFLDKFTVERMEKLLASSRRKPVRNGSCRLAPRRIDRLVTASPRHQEDRIIANAIERQLLR